MSQPLRILARPGLESRTNPYTALIYRDAERHGGRVFEWSVRNVWLERWDIVHVHWPETVFDHRMVEAVAGTEVLLRSVDRARRRGARLVWTAHNLAAHGKRHPGIERRFRARWLRRLDGWIALSPAGRTAAHEAMPALRHVPSAVVPHPHYRGVYRDDCSRAQARAELGIRTDAPVVAFVGRLAPYKGLLELLTAFRGHPDPAARLVIAGAPFDATFVRTVQHLAERDRRVTVHAHFVADADLQTYLRAADLVALPFRSILNSGSAMLALSFDRPVLVPDYGAMPELRADAGERWVHTYRGDVIQTEDLTSALSAAGGLPDRTDGSHLAAFDPDRVASATCRAFRAFRAFRGE